MPQIPIGGEFYVSDSLPISAQECVNLYPNIPQTVATTRKALFRTPGIELFKQMTAAGTEVCRGAHAFKDEAWFIMGDTLLHVDAWGEASAGTSTKVGGAGKVIMADNGSQICVVAPDYDEQFNAYIYDYSAGTFTQVSDVDFDGPVSSMCFLGGYFVFTKADGRKVFISDLRDGASYTSTNFTDAESDPDDSVGVIALGDSLLVFGSETFQQFQNVGGGGFPFQSVQGSVQRKGLAAVHTLIEVNGHILFLGKGARETPAIWLTDGGPPVKISTTAIDNEIASYSTTTISNAFAWSYSEAGAQFVAFTFPGERCFVYDFVSKQWHTRESEDEAGNQGPCRVAAAIEAFNQVLVGDEQGSKVGILNRDTFTEHGNAILRRFVTPHLDNDGDPFNVDVLELACETGAGLTAGQGSDPLIWMSYSKDGGRTFSDPLERSIGQVGEYSKRVFWNSLGRFERDICFKFEVSDPVKWVFRKLEARIE